MTSARMRVNVQSLKDQEAKHQSGVYLKRDLAIVKGQGAHLWDDEGNQYIDCVAGIGACNIGHAHPGVVKAIELQTKQLMVCPEIFYNDQRALLSSLLLQHAPGFNRVFFCNSGTESVEGALKFARVTTGRTGVVACMRGFHGRTMGSLSATWEKKYRGPFEPLVPGFSHVPYNNLDKLKAAVTDETGAVLLEVVQGEGGVRPGTEDFLRGAQELCRDKGAALILDEVQTGMARTGKLFAYMHHDLEPDFLCLAKSLGGGVPMGAILISERVKTIPPRVHGSTFGGNPLACAAALATLEVIDREKLSSRSAELGARFQEKLRGLASDHIREVRGLGLMIGIELKGKVAPLVKELTARGVLTLPAGMNVLRLLPPLVIEEADLDKVVDAIGESLETL